MSFFINEDETVKIYFDKKGHITEKETENWFEVKKDINYILLNEIKNAIKPKTMKMNATTNEIELDTTKMGEVPLNLLLKIIVNWSEETKLDLNILRTKLHSKIIEQLWAKILEIYDIGV